MRAGEKEHLEIISSCTDDINKQFEATMRLGFVTLYDALQNNLVEIVTLEEAAAHKIAVSKFIDLLFPLKIETPLEKQKDPNLYSEYVCYRKKVERIRNAFSNIYEVKEYKKDMSQKLNFIMNLWWVHRQNISYL